MRFLGFFFILFTLNANAQELNPTHAETTAPDILDFLKAETNKYRAGSLDLYRHPTPSPSGYLQAELHVSDEPKTQKGEATYVESSDKLIGHPIGGSIIRLIDNTPKGAVIRVAVFIFKDNEVKKALMRALDRGVIVNLLTTDKGAQVANALSNYISKLNEPLYLSPTSENNEEDAADLPRNKNSSSAQLCSNKKPHGPGGCLSSHLMHHKFVTISRICRFGLITEQGPTLNQCVKAESKFLFRRVVVQGSWNFGGFSKYNIASIFIGNASLYRTYVNHFELMKYFASNNERYTSSIILPVSHKMANGGALQVSFTPRTQNPSLSGGVKLPDIVLSHFTNLLCKTKIENRWERTVVRIANTHWSQPRAQEIIDLVKRLSLEGCIVKVLLPADMAAVATQTSSNTDETGESDNEGNADSELPIGVSVSDAKIYNALIEAGARVRSMAYAPNATETTRKNAAHIHTKYVLVSNSLAPQNDKLAFGTLSFTHAQEANDEAWLVWDQPSTSARDFYTQSFERMWEALPEYGKAPNNQ